jgi:hypothetical protein
MATLVNLCNFKTPLFENDQNEAKWIIVIEPTLQSYKKAEEWFSDNEEVTDVYVMIIPFSENHKFPVLNVDEPYYPDYLTENSLEIVPFTLEMVITTIEILTKRIITRFVATGISLLQSKMIEFITKGLTKDEIIGACKLKYDISMKIIRQQYNELTVGNYPRIKYHHLDALPHALVNGPFPFNPKNVANAVEKKINNGKFVFVDNRPYCGKYIFTYTKNIWLSEYMESKDGEITFPYGISYEDFEEEDIEYLNSLGELTIKPKCLEKMAVEIKWNPVFIEGEFDPDSYLTLWIEKAIDLYIEKRIKIVESQEFMELKRKFIRTICTSQREYTNGYECLLFIGENENKKRQRINLEYSGCYDLLDIPIKDFHLDVIFENDKHIPESARDMLLEEIKKLHLL